MIVQIQPSTLTGSIQSPASKSSMQRACAAALLSVGTTCIINPGSSNDDKAALEVIQKLGASIEWKPDGTLLVHSEGVRPIADEINCGESGLGIRMFTPIAAISRNKLLINGTGSLLKRPMDFFDTILPQLGVSITSTGGKLPISIHGPLTPVDIEIDGSLSSQFLTGLLMAFAAVVKAPVTITVKDLKSKPYIALTLRVMELFGVPVTNNDFKTFSFTPVKSGYSAREYTVEGDWSGAAFLLVAGAIGGDIKVHGLDIYSTQADRAVLIALQRSKANIDIKEDFITIQQSTLSAFEFDATDCPDLFPPLVALASFCEGTTKISGAGRLTHKESNRALTLQEEFKKLGIDIELEGDSMLVTGKTSIHSAVVHSRHDHRIAMACAVAALRATGDVVIEEAEAINKSYPAFFEDLKTLGATLTISD